MKVLHIGWGFKPWWGGGYSEYLEDLLQVQSRRGYKVSYLCSGRRYEGFKGPHLIKWKAFGIEVREILNSPSAQSLNNPDEFRQIELDDRRTEPIIKDCIKELSPDIVHIHQLIGLSTSIIDLVKGEFNLPLVITLHDYFLFCPKVSLFDYRQENCGGPLVGDKCAVCMLEEGPGLKEHRVRSSLEIKNYFLYRLFVGLYRLLARLKPSYNGAQTHVISERDPASMTRERLDQVASYFQNRRNINISRIKKADMIIAPSYRVKEIIRSFAGDDISGRIVVLPYSLKHIEEIRPNTVKCAHPLRFITLQGCSNPGKGSRVVTEALEILDAEGYADKFKLYVYGYIDPEISERLVRMKNVFYKGLYDTRQLNRILNDKDVGIVHSQREEPYGIVGLELLAKGIPVIGSPRGGIVDYVKDGFTGWLNKSSDSKGLAIIMEDVINNPVRIEALSKKIVENRGLLIKDMDEHFAEVERIYLRTSQ